MGNLKPSVGAAMLRQQPHGMHLRRRNVTPATLKGSRQVHGNGHRPRKLPVLFPFSIIGFCTQRAGNMNQCCKQIACKYNVMANVKAGRTNPRGDCAENGNSCSQNRNSSMGKSKTAVMVISPLTNVGKKCGVDLNVRQQNGKP